MQGDTFRDYIPIAKKVGWRLFFALLLHCLYYVFALFTGWPIPLQSVDRLAEITDISFPASTQLVRGDDHCFPGSGTGGADALIRLPAKDLSVFMHQKGMYAFSPLGPDNSLVWGFDGVKRYDRHMVSQTLQVAHFANGSETNVWVNTDDPKWAKVYIEYYEP